MAPMGLQKARRANARKRLEDLSGVCFGGSWGLLVLADLGGCSFARFFADSSSSVNNLTYFNRAIFKTMLQRASPNSRPNESI